MASPRVLHVIPTLDRSGAEKQLTMLACGLGAHGFEVEVCALTREGPYAETLRANGVPVSCISKRMRIDPTAAWRLRALLRDRKPAIVHTWLFAANAYGRFAARSAGIPVQVASERCADEWKPRWALAIDRWLARTTHCVIVNSTAVRDYYRAAGIREKLLRVIPNGVEVSDAGPAERAASRTQLGIAPDQPVLGFVGRMARQKRVEDLIWAVELLRHVLPNLQLLLMGDGPEAERLAAYAQRLQLASFCRFLGHRNDAAACLRACDIVVLPSAFEGMPNVLLEAMAEGVPVVASDIAAHRALVRHGETGYLYPKGDALALGRTLLSLLEDRPHARAIGEAGRAVVRADYRVEAMVTAHAALYRELLERPAAAGN